MLLEAYPFARRWIDLAALAPDVVIRRFGKHGGSLGETNSVSFQFKKMGVFRLNPEGVDQDDLDPRAHADEEWARLRRPGHLPTALEQDGAGTIVWRAQQAKS